MQKSESKSKLSVTIEIRANQSRNLTASRGKDSSEIALLYAVAVLTAAGETTSKVLDFEHPQ